MLSVKLEPVICGTKKYFHDRQSLSLVQQDPVCPNFIQEDRIGSLLNATGMACSGVLLLLAPIRDRQPAGHGPWALLVIPFIIKRSGSAGKLVWPFDRMDCASSLPAASGLDRRKGFTAAALVPAFRCPLFPALEAFSLSPA